MKTLAVLAVALAALAACYPTKCDPAKDPTGCACPSGACGPYPGPTPGGPERARDAGADR